MICKACGEPMEEVRPGKWQCVVEVECDELTTLRQRAETVEAVLAQVRAKVKDVDAMGPMGALVVVSEIKRITNIAV